MKRIFKLQLSVIPTATDLEAFKADWLKTLPNDSKAEMEILAHQPETALNVICLALSNVGEGETNRDVQAMMKAARKTLDAGTRFFEDIQGSARALSFDPGDKADVKPEDVREHDRHDDNSDPVTGGKAAQPGSPASSAGTASEG